MAKTGLTAFMALAAPVVAILTLASCSTVKGMFGQKPPEEFSVHYEPGAEDPATADAEAETRCAAYGLGAVFIDETQDSMGRLRHRHYRCE